MPSYYDMLTYNPHDETKKKTLISLIQGRPLAVESYEVIELMIEAETKRALIAVKGDRLAYF